MKYKKIMALINNLELTEREFTTLLASIYDKQTGRVPDIVKKFEMYVHFHSSLEEISLKSTAEHFHISVSTLCRKLRNRNVSLNQLLINERKHHIKKDICNGADIANLLGFSDPSYFYQSLKRWTGMNFSQIKKKMEVNPQEIDRILNVRLKK
jgi:AraC-like DNA-binding protein